TGVLDPPRSLRSAAARLCVDERRRSSQFGSCPVDDWNLVRGTASAARAGVDRAREIGRYVTRQAGVSTDGGRPRATEGRVAASLTCDAYRERATQDEGNLSVRAERAYALALGLFPWDYRANLGG